ncbi:MAG: iron-sulfur cluster assembly protein [Rhodospirillaceae bacterium]|nr:iron-sulfur cluster assembly protein [Rhodospirillaceae bacterium]
MDAPQTQAPQMSGCADPAVAAVWACLDTIPDPCHALSGHDLSIVDLGLINGISRDGGSICISVTFTDPSCVFSYKIIMDLEDLAATLDGVSDITVSADPYPLWTEDRLSDKARTLFADKRTRFGFTDKTKSDAITNEGSRL